MLDLMFDLDKFDVIGSNQEPNESKFRANALEEEKTLKRKQKIITGMKNGQFLVNKWVCLLKTLS